MPEYTMPFRAVVFDLDGTLADSLEGIASAMNTVLSEHGLPIHPTESYRLMVGEGVETLIQKALPPTSQDKAHVILNEYRGIYASKMQETQAFAGIEDMLSTLTELQIHMSVLSNKRDDFTVSMVNALFRRWHFVGIRGERVGVPRKPHPGAALELAAQMGVLPSQCAFIGDTSVDMQTAVAAGMLPVGVLWGFRGMNELRDAGARFFLSHPMELFELHKRTPI